MTGTEPDAGALTDEARRTWETVAPSWERHAAWLARGSEPVTRWLIDHLDPSPGETILELGAGPGDTGFEAARRIEPQGRLISSDLGPAMVEVARRRAAALGLENIEFSVIDAQRIDREDGSVDGVIHRYGPMLLPDPASSVAEVRRVLRDGRYVAAVWDAPDHNPWVLAIGLSLMQHGFQPAGDPFGPGGVFSLADPDALRGLLENAGFREVVVEPVEQPFLFADFDEVWNILSEISGPVSVIIQGLPDDRRADVRASLVGLVENYREGQGYHLPARALCVHAS